MHFAAFLDVGESVREPAALLPQQRRRRAERARGDGRRVGHALRLLLDLRHLRRADRDADSPKRIRSSPINSYGETKLAVERALPHFERAYGLRWTALRYFNAAGADPDGEIGEDHSPEIHLIPRAIEAATGGPGLQVFGDDYPTPDGTCLRDYIHVSDLADAHVQGARGDRRDGRVGAYNLGTGHAALGARGHRRGRAGRRPAGALDAGAAARRRSGGAVRRRPARRRPRCAGRRASPISTRSCAPRGRGTERIRTGIAATTHS